VAEQDAEFVAEPMLDRNFRSDVPKTPKPSSFERCKTMSEHRLAVLVSRNGTVVVNCGWRPRPFRPPGLRRERIETQSQNQPFRLFIRVGRSRSADTDRIVLRIATQTANLLKSERPRRLVRGWGREEWGTEPLVSLILTRGQRRSLGQLESRFLF
jgi:hypothetical protein